MRRCLKILIFIGAFGLAASFGQSVTKMSPGDKGWSDLEKLLSQHTEKGLKDVRNKDLEAMQNGWASQFFEINSGGTFRSKADQLERIRQRPFNPKAGPASHDFKLLAVYGNGSFALAMDQTTLTGVFDKGHDFSGEYRVLRVFVKEDGKWKTAATALCPIVPH